jgi:predicted ATPase
LAIIHQLRQEQEACRQCAQRAFEVAVQQGFAYRQAVALVLRGWAVSHQGKASDGLASLLRGVDACRQAGAELDRPYYLALLADMLLRQSKPDEAFAPLAEAIAQVRTSRSFFYEAELWRLRGVALLAMQQLSAEESLAEALELARRQHARSLQLRVAISLAEFWRSSGDPQRARQLLAKTHASFTEGFDCPDLVVARNLLQLLATDKKRARSTRLSA